MRLTNSIRSAYVRSVMHDVPQKDNQSLLANLVEGVIREGTPEEVLAMYDRVSAKDYMVRTYLTVSCQNRAFADEFGQQQFYTAPDSIPVPSTLRAAVNPWGQGGSTVLEVSKLGLTGKQGELRRLCAEIHKQNNLRATAESNLRSLANSCTTVKALREAAPEFSKYLPKETGQPADRSVPVVRGVVDFVRAAGWTPPSNPPIVAS